MQQHILFLIRVTHDLGYGPVRINDCQTLALVLRQIWARTFRGGSSSLAPDWRRHTGVSLEPAG